MIYGFDEYKHKIDVINPTELLNMEFTSTSMETFVVSYPANFNYGNTIILGVAVRLHGGVDWYWGDNKIKVQSLKVRVSTEKIYLDVTPTEATTLDFKLILARQS